ncbi:SesA [Moelleriella libera RCEF 2490]|uniref:SesA n=1 Tax=Moelleriella libera RCEF 2490 TaxID=1081109 RepID=A0A167YVL5_9HYPO|nr:SesA [Moelleriella libera RCEF 2490]
MPSSSSTNPITDALYHVVNSEREYAALSHDKTFGKAFHGAGKGLPLVAKALMAVQSQHAKNNRASLEMLGPVKTKAETYCDILKTIAKTPEDRLAQYQQAVTKRGHGARVEELLIGMMSDLCLCAEKLELKDQVETLRKAMKSLSNMEPSLPAKPGNRFAAHVAGDQFNAVDGGIMNTTHGNGGYNFPGATFAGGTTFGAIH